MGAGPVLPVKKHIYIVILSYLFTTTHNGFDIIQIKISIPSTQLYFCYESLKFWRAGGNMDMEVWTFLGSALELNLHFIGLGTVSNKTIGQG